MNLSWNKKLFLKINKYQGKHLWLDKLMQFSSVYLIYIIGILAFLPTLIFSIQTNLGINWFLIFRSLLVFFIAIISGLVISYFTGWFWPHRRPGDELEGVRLLVRLKNFEHWKTFPSDHAFMSLALAILGGLIVLYHWWYSVFLIILAGLVSMGRMYTGVHYPRDIIGGILLALLVCYFVNMYFVAGFAL